MENNKLTLKKNTKWWNNKHYRFVWFSKIKLKRNRIRKFHKYYGKTNGNWCIEHLRRKQDSYIDPAEHIYDACKTIKRHLDDEDLIMYPITSLKIMLNDIK